METDVIIQVGENHDTKEFRAHSAILRAKSPYFRSALSADRVTKENNMIMVNKPNITPTVFSMVLKYIYTEKLDLDENSDVDILGLLIASDELLMETLFKRVQNYLIKQRSPWIQQNLDCVLPIEFKLTCCKKLQDYCFDVISKNPLPFINSKTFLLLDKVILFRLLSMDGLLIDDTITWDNLIEWGIKQIPGLENKNNHDEWTDKNYEDLKNALRDFIPFIKFLNITSEDFYYKVRPYKAIIPNDIYEKVMEYNLIERPKLYRHLVIPQIDSKIIKSKHATIISNWIDRNSSVLSPKNKYKFNLIYLMSRDGFNRILFYDKCNDQGPFVVLIRVGSKKIYGGYNPIGYARRRNEWLSSTESFIFSFENDYELHNMIISRVINAKYSVYDNLNDSSFFNFGGTLSVGGQNVYLSHKMGNYDDVFNESINSPIEEMEVFSIKK